jgi:hypothetical protein
MLPSASVPLPVPEPLALLDATLLFLIQVLIAQHPDLLAPSDEHDDTLHPAYPLRAARHILLAVREVHYALDTYRAVLPDKRGFMSGAGADDDFPF